MRYYRKLSLAFTACLLAWQHPCFAALTEADCQARGQQYAQADWLDLALIYLEEAIRLNPSKENIERRNKLAASKSVMPETGETNEAAAQEINKFLSRLGVAWNRHDLEALGACFSDDFLNLDGLTKTGILNITKEFWESYPDATTTSTTSKLRIKGNLASVLEVNKDIGTTAKRYPGLSTNGQMNSKSTIKSFLKNENGHWKVIARVTEDESTTVTFGAADMLTADIATPTTVESGGMYNIKLDVKGGNPLRAIFSLTNPQIEYPKKDTEDEWRDLEESSRTGIWHGERRVTANTSHHNEQAMATVGLTDHTKRNLLGLLYVTKRVHVLPVTGTPIQSDKPVQHNPSQKQMDSGRSI